jgi:iron complex outermembrane receptor protein
VVNIITRREFDGGQVTVNYGEYSKGDGTQKGVDLAWGTNGDRYSLFLGASWTKQDPVYANTREQSRYPVPGTGLSFGSSATPTGRFMFTDPNTGIAYNITPNNGATDPTFNGVGGCARTDDYHCFTTADRFNFAEYNLLLTPSERKGIFGQFRFDLTDNVQWYIKALGNRRESTNQAGPEPLFFGPDGATGNPLADNIVISALNPYNPFGFDLDSSSNLSMIGPPPGRRWPAHLRAGSEHHVRRHRPGRPVPGGRPQLVVGHQRHVQQEQGRADQLRQLQHLQRQSGAG